MKKVITTKQKLAAIIKGPVNNWEKDFALDIQKKCYAKIKLTKKQKEVINSIYSRLKTKAAFKSIDKKALSSVKNGCVPNTTLYNRRFK